MSTRTEGEPAANVAPQRSRGLMKKRDGPCERIERLGCADEGLRLAEQVLRMKTSRGGGRQP